MSNKMLIDASHPEETRVVVVKNNRIAEYDFESEHKKQITGNIYLARVTRVEPSLQAAFVEYGGNKQGFLAFSEIHPDYYQIPVADRRALLEKTSEKPFDSEETEEQVHAERKPNRKKRGKKSNAEKIIEPSKSEEIEIQELETEEENIESLGNDDALEEVIEAAPRQRFQYKIQEVIKKRQIILVQVIKEERGNKGAALTTYLSLAGRYSVLMPNTARGGGISRKITNIQDRKRLKEIVKGLDVPEGMGIILRTAGANRTKAEIKRDYEYLIRLWSTIRDFTLQSTAPCLVHEEGSLIKRSIRDLYNKSIDEILVAGDTGYKEAKSFMRMLMPSHTKVVQPYKDKLPIFARNGIETELDKMLQPLVLLKSGGYLVINQTEALVAIDVNSGRSTRESSIQETAYQTNLEAADEIALQLRLRDLAGLIVIDFIDMEDKKYIRTVEKRLKDGLKEDRARIQVGRISHFGLLEMSRQRIRASVLESTMHPCSHCGGTGHVRSESSIALHVMRSIEEYLLQNANHNIIVKTSIKTALYMLNYKREIITELEKQFGLNISIEADDKLGSQRFIIEKGALSANSLARLLTENLDKESEPAEPKLSQSPQTQPQQESENPSELSSSGRRRRRGRRGGKRNKAAFVNGDSEHSILQPQTTQNLETQNNEKSSAKDLDNKQTQNSGRDHRHQKFAKNKNVSTDGGHSVKDSPNVNKVQRDKTLEQMQKVPLQSEDSQEKNVSQPETKNTEKSKEKKSTAKTSKKRKNSPKDASEAVKDAHNEIEQGKPKQSSPTKERTRATKPFKENEDVKNKDPIDKKPETKKRNPRRTAKSETKEKVQKDKSEKKAPNRKKESEKINIDKNETPKNIQENTGLSLSLTAKISKILKDTTAERSENEQNEHPKRGWWQRRRFFI